MNIDTSEAILEFVKVHGRAKPVELVGNLGVSKTVIHRHLKRLIDMGKLKRLGNPPKVYYVFVDEPKKTAISQLGDNVIPLDDYLYVSPEGELIPGFGGFVKWVQKIKQDKYLGNLITEYKNIRAVTKNYLSSEGVIDGTEKIKNTFVEMYLDGVYFRDFYSIEKFGKTKLGHLVMLGKTNENRQIMDEIAEECRQPVKDLMHTLHIEAVSFIPHSVQRRIQFNSELANKLNLRVPNISLEKAYPQVIVQQKGLSKLEDRMQNAQGTLFIKELGQKYKTVLLIDDVVGSGATMNEMAKKLKQSGVAEKVYGFAVVGSMNGFDVIPVV